MIIKKELIQKIINETNVNKATGKKLISLIELISSQAKIQLATRIDSQNLHDKFSSQKHSYTISSLSGKVLLPLPMLASINCGYGEVKILCDTVLVAGFTEVFTIYNEEQFDSSVISPMYHSEEDRVKARENIILQISSGFSGGSLKEFVSALIKHLPENAGVIQLIFNEKGLSRNYEGEVIDCPIKVNSDRYRFLAAILNGPVKRDQIILNYKKLISLNIYTCGSRGCSGSI